jgi:decaprenylphospho-beta-D-ribofuranose 2-oxidase
MDMGSSDSVAWIGNSYSAKSNSLMTNVKYRLEKISGWGRNFSSTSSHIYPQSVDDIQETVQAEDGPKLLARGKGRSYGDASLNANRITLQSSAIDRAVSFDKTNGILVCEAGITLRAVLEIVVPHSWFLHVTPGTSLSTLGGCVACDVHGKNHHLSGSFYQNLLWVDLITANGKVVRCSSEENVDLFKATVGGMGLTGIIYQLAIQLIPVETSAVVENKIAVRNLSEMLELLSEPDDNRPYSVAWIDTTSKGEKFGRGEVIFGRHANLKDLPDDWGNDPLITKKKSALTVPCGLPFSLVENSSTSLFNYLKTLTASKEASSETRYFFPFFYPLDSINGWNRFYGKSGFIQYQFVVDLEFGERAIRQIITKCHQRGIYSSLAVLKKMGPSSDGLLSFPKPGWTLAMDFPVTSDLFFLLNELDRIVLEHGGRIYLAKDSRLSPGTFRNMYKQEYSQFMDIKSQVDPQWKFSSQLSRRLKMEEGI